MSLGRFREARNLDLRNLVGFGSSAWLLGEKHGKRESNLVVPGLIGEMKGGPGTVLGGVNLPKIQWFWRLWSSCVSSRVKFLIQGELWELGFPIMFIQGEIFHPGWLSAFLKNSSRVFKISSRVKSESSRVKLKFHFLRKSHPGWNDNFYTSAWIPSPSSSSSSGDCSKSCGKLE